MSIEPGGPTARDSAAEANLDSANLDSAGSTDSDLEPGGPPDEQERKPGSFLKELPILVLIAFGLALLIKTFLIQAFYIPSESMVPTLNIKDRVLVNKVVYKIRAPKRGEVIVFVGQRIDRGKRSFWQKVRETLTSGLGGAQPAELDYIKRVIALPGETVQLERGIVTITPKRGPPLTLDEPYIAEQKDPTPYPPFIVPKGEFFVLGDNRPNSSDSRYSIGTIPRRDIVGRAFVRIWPLSRFRGMGRPDYAGGAGGALILGLVRARRRRSAIRGLLEPGAVEG